jgi:Tol biopolymer transport system component
MADIHVALDDLRQDIQSGVLAQPAIPAPANTKRRLPWIAIAAVLTAVAATAAAMALWNRTPQAQPLERYTIRPLTYDIAANVSPAISPDGKFIAYASDRAGGNVDLWVQQVAGGEPIKLASGGLCHDPSFSPDGSRVLFRGGADGRGIFVVSALGGTPRNVANGWAPRWSPDGTQISYVDPAKSRIMIVPAGSGTAREVPTNQGISGRALWLPDGKTLLYFGLADPARKLENDWYTAPVEGGAPVATGAAEQFKAAGAHLVTPHSLTPAGVLVTLGPEGSNLYRVPFDFSKRRVTGPPVPITVAPGVNFWPSASADGQKIAFGSATRFNTNLWQIAIDANGVASGDLRRITDGLEERFAPFPSPDGKYLAYNSQTGSIVETRIRNLATGEETRIGEASAASPPVISDDGTEVAYAVMEDGRLSIYAAPVRGGLARRLCTRCGRPIEWYAKATKLLFDRGGEQQREIGVLDVATGQTKPLLRHSRYRLFTPRISPDGRTLCFTAVAGPLERRFFVVPFTPDRIIEEQEWKNFMDGADQRQPFWSANGQILYFLSERDGFRCVWARRFNRDSMQPVGEPFAVRHFHAFRHGLLDFGDVADIGLSVHGSTMFLAARELLANIWLAESAPPAKREQP